MPTPLVSRVRNELSQAADAEKAGPMQRYMKSAMPFYGVQAPQVKKICQAVFREYTFADQAGWHEAMLDLWRTATHREQRYVALNLAGIPHYRRFQDLATLDVYEEMVVTGAWWDLVDSVAGRLGELLADRRKPMTRAMKAWSRDADFWQRRAAILCQLAAKERTDEKLLFACIRANVHHEEFFVRKAIGWALRNYAKTNPHAVVDFVTAHRAELGPLSKREALRILLKDGYIDAIP